jgi:threonyl-tRNA synthetase
LIPITEAHIPYCEEMGRKLKALGVRFEIDSRNEKMGLKTREAQMSKIPLMLVAGDREVEEGTFAVRKYGARDSETLKGETILSQMQEWNDLPKKPFRR